MTDPDFDKLSSLGLIPYAALRPNRVYALEEMLDFDDPDTPSRQRAALKEARIAHARFIRIASRSENNAWLILLSERKPFDADDSALLSSIAPHLAVALDTLGELGAQQLRATIAEQALEMLGIGQMALDREGRVILTDSLAAKLLGTRGGARLNLPAETTQTLAEGCAAMMKAPSSARRVIDLDKTDLRHMLLRPLPSPMGTAIVAIGTVRQPQKQKRGAPPRVVAQLLGLSEREAALAEAMSRGESILEAGAQLQLTPETARNYTKRAYAKTGATGQADLVRQVLTGLAPLA